MDKLKWMHRLGHLIKWIIYGAAIIVAIDTLIGAYIEWSWMGIVGCVALFAIMWWLDDKMTEWLS